MANGPICLRLPADLHHAVDEAAAATNMNVSEWLRALIFQTIYGEPIGASEGYVAGRKLGMRITQMMLARAYTNLPDSPEEALKMIQETMSLDRDG